jgi:hypothetical protein
LISTSLGLLFGAGGVEWKDGREEGFSAGSSVLGFGWSLSMLGDSSHVAVTHGMSELFGFSMKRTSSLEFSAVGAQNLFAETIARRVPQNPPDCT